MQYASFIKRLLAAIFDMALVSFVVMALAPLMIDMQALQPVLDKSKAQLPISLDELTIVTQAFLVLAVSSTLLYIIMDVAMPASRFMSSPGKLLFKLVVVDTNGQRLGIGKSIARHAAKFISALTIIGFLMPLWNTQKRALHDIMSATLVINKKSLRR